MQKWTERDEKEKQALVAQALSKAETFKKKGRINQGMAVLKDFQAVIEQALKADTDLTLVDALKIINATAGTNVDRTTLYAFLKEQGLKREQVKSAVDCTHEQSTESEPEEKQEEQAQVQAEPKPKRKKKENTERLKLVKEVADWCAQHPEDTGRHQAAKQFKLSERTIRKYLAEVRNAGE